LAQGFPAVHIVFCSESLALLLTVTEHQEQPDVHRDQQPNSCNTVLHCRLVTLLVLAGKPEQGG